MMARIHARGGIMTGRQLKDKLRSGARVYGTLLVSPSPHYLALAERVGLDFVFIDTEHIALDRLTLAWMCQAYAAKGLPPLVRIPSPDPFQASMVLDGGAAGIIAPYVESAAQARDLVGAVKFKPLKGERLARALDRAETLEPALRDYLSRQNADRLVIVNIESRPAIENLDAILQVDGLDAVLIGPHDLSLSLGIPEDYLDQRFLSAVDGIIEKARARGMGAGIHAISGAVAQNQPRWARRGANLILHSADIIAAREKLAGDMRRLREELGDQDPAAGGDNMNI